MPQLSGREARCISALKAVCTRRARTMRTTTPEQQRVRRVCGCAVERVRRATGADARASERYLFLGWLAELSYTGPRYLFLGWSAELSYTGPRYLFLGWLAELSYTGPRSFFLGWSAELSYTGPRSFFLGWTAELSYIRTHARTYLMMGEELGN